MRLHFVSLASALLQLSAGGAGATPFAASLVTNGADAQIIQVAGGCGFGEHRGPYGGCRINPGPRGRIRASVTGLPLGCPPGLHRGPYGHCH